MSNDDFDKSVMKNSVTNITRNIIVVIYFALTAASFFTMMVIDRVLYFEYVKYLLVMNIFSLACVSFLINKKIIAIIVIAVVTLTAPLYYFNMYGEIKNADSKKYVELTGGGFTYKFYTDENKNFILVRKNNDNYDCYGPYRTNATECTRLGLKLF